MGKTKHDYSMKFFGSVKKKEVMLFYELVSSAGTTRIVTIETTL